MGSDLHYLSPCCGNEDYRLLHGRFENCSHCEGSGSVFVMKMENEIEYINCSFCDGLGYFEKDTYECNICKSKFTETLLKDVIYDYED